MKFQILSIIFDWLPTIAFLIGMIYGAFLVIPKAALADPSLLSGYIILGGSIVLVILWPLLSPSSGIDFNLLFQNTQVFDNISPISRLVLIHLQETHNTTEFLVTSAELFTAIKKSVISICGLSEIEADAISHELVQIVVHFYNNSSLIFKF